MTKYKVIHVLSGESSIIERDTTPTFDGLLWGEPSLYSNKYPCWAFWVSNQCNDIRCSSELCHWHASYNGIEAEYLIEKL